MHRRKNAEVDLKLWYLFRGDREKPGVLKGCCSGRLSHGAIHRVDGKDIADAPAKLAAAIKSSKESAGLR
jgi:hypothetical protein